MLFRVCNGRQSATFSTNAAEWPRISLAFPRSTSRKRPIDPVDPITYAKWLKGKRLILIAASRD